MAVTDGVTPQLTHEMVRRTLEEIHQERLDRFLGKPVPQTAKRKDPQAVKDPAMLPLPKGWEKTACGKPMPNVAAWVRESRAGH